MVFDREFVRSLNREIHRARKLNLHVGRQHMIEKDLRVKAESVGRRQRLTHLG